MNIPKIKCTNCGYIFSVQICQEGSESWLEIDPDHGCPYEPFDTDQDKRPEPILD